MYFMLRDMQEGSCILVQIPGRSPSLLTDYYGSLRIRFTFRDVLLFSILLVYLGTGSRPGIPLLLLQFSVFISLSTA